MEIGGQTPNSAHRNVLRVQFELTTHMRGGTLGQLALVAGAAGGVPEVGTPISGAKISDYWKFQTRNGS
jgi:hypothetical protein